MGKPIMLVVLLTVFLVLVAGLTTVEAAFGISSSSGKYTVDTGNGLVYQVDQDNCNIVSMKYNGVETQDSSKYTHIGSGLGSGASVSGSLKSSSTVAFISCTTDTLTHYIIAKKNTNNIYFATYISSEPSVGELRLIARLKASAVPNYETTASDITNNDGAIEASDVYAHGTETRSKFYSGVQFINDQVHGATGSSLGVWMVIPGYSYESSSGGPFFKDIDNQKGSQQEVYFYMNSGHTQTESNRVGVLHGPYALVFNSGSKPSSDLDTSFLDSLGLTGYVAVSGRGYIKGKASGIPSAFQSKVTIHWYNDAAQYWAKADSSTQNFYSPAMKPGTYTMLLYKNELAVGSKSVTVSAGTTSTVNIKVSDDSSSNPLVNAPSSLIFSIGDLDGTPSGFLNAENLKTMHPSDSRMSAWTSSFTYTVGSTDVSNFPAVLWKSVNSPLNIKFTLTASQAAAARTFRIAITLAYAGGRPVISINGGSSSATPAASTQPDSRGITRGTYRGNNHQFTYSIAANTFVSGTNTIAISVASGSSGDTYLSPNFVFDYVDLF